MENIYDLLGISEESTVEEIEAAYASYTERLRAAYDRRELSDDEFIQKFQEGKDAYTQARADRIAREAAEPSEENEEEQEQSNGKSHTVRNLLIGAGCLVLAGAIALSTQIGWKLGKKAALTENEQTRAAYYTSLEESTEAPEESETLVVTTEAPTEKATETATEAPTEKATEAPTEAPTEKATEAPTEKATEAPTEKATEAPTEAPTEKATEGSGGQTAGGGAERETEDTFDRGAFAVPNYADVMDDTVVMKRAQVLEQQLIDAGVFNPETGAYYTADQIFALIKYANGVYIPSSTEEIDILHLNLLNLMISPLNTDAYLYHAVYANGNNDFTDLLVDNPVQVGFAESFAEYGENGVYPLIQWIQQKRFDIFATKDRDEIAKIYDEVGQVMADLMKGNGCTITWEGVEYRFTSEQVLANHSSAMILTTEAQLVFANHYEIRNEYGEIVESGKTSWDVYNKFNSNGVDENGQPIIAPDHVTLDEIQAWINNGCDYEWAIDSVLINGQTFGQRIQGDMEGMALNNLAVGLTK